MAKLGKEKFHFGDKEDRLTFDVDVYVLKDGTFTLTLPPDISGLFEYSGIYLTKNQLGNSGYFQASTHKELMEKVSNVGTEYFSKELIEESIVIQYAIDTICSYVMGDSGDISPNGMYAKNYEWVRGSKNDTFNHNEPFTLCVYAKMFTKKVYKFRSGKIKTDYEPLSNHQKESKFGQFANWLMHIPNIGSGKNAKVKEIEYNEPTAEFFVNLIRSICSINEKIKDFTEPDKIKMIIASNQKFIG